MCKSVEDINEENVNEMIRGLNHMCERSHNTARAKGFWQGVYTEDVNVQLAKLMLMVTEVAEAAEDVRTGNREHLGEELADIVIRVGDFCGALGVNLGDKVFQKQQKNEKRVYMHGKLA